MALPRPLRSSIPSLGRKVRPALATVAMALAALLFTACPGGGGGGAAPESGKPGPVIQTLRVEPGSVFRGSKAKLSFIFTGSGQVDGGVGAVTSGVPVEVAADADKVYTLTVTGSGGRSEQRSVPLKVVRALPSASAVSISAPGSAQAGRAGYVASVPDLEGFTCRWSGENLELTSDPARTSVRFRPGVTGAARLDCVLSHADGRTVIPAAAALEVTSALPPPAVTAPRQVTAGQGGYVASIPVPDGGSVLWSISDGTLTSDPKSPTVTFTAAPGTVELNCRLTDAAGVKAPPIKVAVPVVAAPGAAVIAAPAQAKAGRPATASVPAQAGCVHHWNIIRGRFEGPATGESVTFVPEAEGETVLNCVAINQAGTPGAPGSVTVRTRAEVPPASITAPARVTAGHPGCKASVAPRSGHSYAWRVQNATATSPLTGPDLLFTPGPGGTVTLECVITDAEGVEAAPGTAVCTVVPAPAKPAVTGLPVRITSGAAVTAAVTPQPGSRYAWTVTGGAVAAGGGPGDTTVTVTAGPAGPLTVTCAAVNALGVAGPAHTAPSHISMVPGAPALAPIAAPRGGQSVTATVSAPDPGLTYRWTITNGQLTSAAQGTSATFTAGDYGTLHVDCVAVNAALAPSPRTRTSLPITPVKVSVASAFLADGMPYLQPGSQPSDTSLSLLWMRPGNVDQAWRVDVAGPDGVWHTQSTPPAHRTVDLSTTPAASEPVHRVYVQPLRNLPSGGRFLYRVSLDNAVVFQDEGRALKAPGQRQVVAVAGDLVSNDIPATRAIASRIMQHDPDLMVVPGDIVNLEGHANQYRNSFFSNYNAEATGPSGAALMRQLPLAACLGNNDTDRAKEPRGFPAPKRVTRDTVEPNGMAYYYYFDFPLNGPDLTENLQSPNMVMPGQPQAYQPFRTAAGNRFLKMNNFSFDSGDVHWVFLDSMYYMDWNDPALQAWLTADLQAASFGPKAKTWKIAVFHYPVYTNQGFHGAYSGDEGSRMRPVYPILQQFGVALTLSGHLHNYQRCRPFSFNPGAPVRTVDVPLFTPLPPPALPPTIPFRTFDNAAIVEDAAFTGAAAADNQTNGIISIITGAGGAHFHGGPGHMRAPGILPTPVRFVTNPVHSFSLLEFNGNRLLFRQIDANGNELDRFVLVK